MKKCTKCNKNKSEKFFTFKDKSGKKRSVCKTCLNKYQRKYYGCNSSQRIKQRERVKKNKKRYYAETQERILGYLRSNPCVDCGESDPIVLEFDHLKNKRTEVSKLVRWVYSWKTILKEIAKCEVRCANCHRRKTSKQQGWYKSK